GAIFFAAGYWFYYHEYEIGPLPLESYAAEVAAAADSSGEVTPELLDALAASSEEVERGRGLFGEHCAVCHGGSGEGNIGPNLTDNRWLHGGATMSIHTTIRDGVGAKGMPGWGSTLGPSAVRSLAVFVASIRDTNVPGKEGQGEVWTGADAPAPGAEAAAPEGEPDEATAAEGTEAVEAAVPEGAAAPAAAAPEAAAGLEAAAVPTRTEQ
ncbi:MAG: c-type cytochrome, partial [Polyangiaceae bacterium]|nr:c-type cytochrome [Polyangiaceae bacterium]